MDLLQFLIALPLALAVPLFVMAALQRLELRAPARLQRRSDSGANLKIWAPNLLANLFAHGPLAAAVTMALNAAGLGQVALPTDGWGLALSVIVYALAMDFGEYVYHRAQHAIPALWRLHALHHSDATFDATTTVRHHWLDPLLKSVTIWMAVAVIFKAPPLATGVYGALSFWNFVTHSNLKFSLGPASWLLNTPHYHRRHHGADVRYHNSNYAALFPIFDVLTGAYRPSEAGEYPKTGLEHAIEPRRFADIVLWPIKPYRRAASGAPAGR